MVGFTLRISTSLLCAFLALSSVNAGVIHRSAALNGHTVDQSISARSETNINIPYFENQITQIETTLNSFNGQLSTLLNKLRGALHAASRKHASQSGSSTTPKSPSLSSKGGSFDPLSTSNIAVYYGQTPLTTSTNLLDLCANPAITIINLAFLSTFFGPNGYPKTSFGPGCDAPQNALQASKAPGLQNCAQLGQQIAQCQAQGKIILVSLGGYIASSSFPSAASARKFASTLWNLFGAGTGEDPLLRPFGPGIIVDGFDIDNEDHSTAYYTEFATALKRRFSSPLAVASGKRYYLSSTPQCPRPDASIPLEVMRMSDFVNVQFYNNPACNLNAGTGFLDSFEAWSADLAGSQASTRLFIGAPAWVGAGSGYVPGSNLKRIVKRAKKHSNAYGNFGGIAMWDGLEGLANVDSSGVNFVQYAADSLS